MSTFSNTKAGENILPSVDASLTGQMFQVVAELLKDNTINQMDLAECGGFKVLGYILGGLSPRVFTKETVTALSNLAVSIKGNGALN
jgi:hypothetical protein